MNGLFKVPAKWSEDILGWVYVGVLIVCGVVNIATGEAAWLSLVALAILGAVEEKLMKKQGLAWPSNWLVLLFPLYLWQRLKALNLPKHLFWIWLAVAVALTAAELALEDAGMEQAAMAQLTQHMLSQGVDTECVKVELGEEFAPNNYRGKAVFNDGSAVNILVQRKNGEVSVRF